MNTSAVFSSGFSHVIPCRVCAVVYVLHGFLFRTKLTPGTHAHEPIMCMVCRGEQQLFCCLEVK